MTNINNKEELLMIAGGVNLTGTIINAFATGIKTIMDVGRSLGTAIRRLYSGKLCSI